MLPEKVKTRRRFLLLLLVLLLGLLILKLSSSNKVEEEKVDGGSGVDYEVKIEGDESNLPKTNCGPKEDFDGLKNDVLLSPLDPSVINFVQCHHLSPPSRLPYNLKIKAGKDPSEISDQLEILFRNWTTPGFFIECGAHDGEFFSNTLALERDKNWSGLLIEAHPKLVSKLRSRNRKAWTSDVCLSPEHKVSELEFMEVNKTVIKGLGQNGRNRLKLPDSDITGFTSLGKVACFPLMTLLTALEVRRVDLFSLDVEGADLKILKTLPFDDRLVIDILIVSNNLTPEGPEAIATFLQAKGYTTIVQTRDDLIFIRNGMSRWEEILRAFDIKVVD